MGKWDAFLEANNEALWDWITWETLGNPSDTYQRSDTQRGFGLWRMDYRAAAKAARQDNLPGPNHDDGALGRGWFKVYTLEHVDYNAHAALVQTFLPCMEIDEDGRLLDPLSPQRAQQHANGDLHAVFPYNYDDNSGASYVLGANMNEPVLAKVNARRLMAELPRWSTASRSCIAAIGQDIDLTEENNAAWSHRDVNNADASIYGPNFAQQRNPDKTYEKFKGDNDGLVFYSVKTGVEFVGKANQTASRKQFLESTSVQAMNRSNLVAWVRKNYQPLTTRYQIEILCVLLKSNPTFKDMVDEADEADKNDLKQQFPPDWDGFQVRDIGDSAGEIWFPALAIPTQGKAFAKKLGEDDWVGFWEKHFARPLGRAKAELLALFGLQLQGNSQNMLVAFQRNQPLQQSTFIVRDIGDALLNDYFYDVLKTTDVAGEHFAKVWDAEGPDGAYVSTEVAETQNDALPRMTRLGTHLLFFFPPFQQGELAVAKGAHHTARWALAQHQAFLEYMQENLGLEAAGRPTMTPRATPPRTSRGGRRSTPPSSSPWATSSSSRMPSPATRRTAGRCSRSSKRHASSASRRWRRTTWRPRRTTSCCGPSWPRTSCCSARRSRAT